MSKMNSFWHCYRVIYGGMCPMGGNFIDITQGISLGCPLSPLMGALFLKPLDDKMAQLGCFYTQYMDDWVILTPTRWKLRQAIRAVNQVMNDLLVLQHPDKTFIGRIERGFDFLGYWFTPKGLGVAGKTVDRMLERASRQYSQGADNLRIETYLRRWWRWVISGVDGVLSALPKFDIFRHWQILQLLSEGLPSNPSITLMHSVFVTLLLS